MERIISNIWEKMKEIGAETILKTLLEKLKQIFFEAFPTEKLDQRINVIGLPFMIITGLVLFLLCSCCCGGRKKQPVKMMKAPGRNSRMPRKSFEDNPRNYFQNLHPKKSS